MTNFEWTAAFIIACLSTARITRLIVWDKYPPVAWLRIKWDTYTEDSEWNLLLHCGYCFAFWVATAIVGWVGLSLHLTGDIHWTWWAFNALMSVAYLGAIVMAYDGEEL